MIAKTLVFVCAAFGLVAGSCVEFRTQKQCPSQLVTVEATPVMTAPVMSAPVMSAQLVSTPSCSTNHVFGNDVTVGQFSNAQSVVGNNLFSTGSESNGNNNVVLSFDGNNGNNGNNGLVGVFGEGNTNGPETAPLPVVQAPDVTLPTVESPMVTLSAPAVPAPRVLASRCVCTKTVVKPQVYQRVVTVPKVQRYLKRTVTPVVENLVYKSRPLPVNGNNDNNNVVSSGTVSGSGLVSGSGFVNSGSSTVVVSGNSSPVYSSGSSSNCRVC